MICLYVFLTHMNIILNRIIILFICCLLANSVLAQIKEGDLSVIHFLNGDTLQVDIVDQNQWITTVLKPKKKEFKYAYKSFNNDQILYINQNDLEKKFMYKYDPSIGNFMEMKEMEQYVKGRTKAKYYYSAKNPFLIAFLLGISIGLIDTYNFNDASYPKGFFNHPAGLISLTTPLISSSIFGNNRIVFADKKNQTEEQVLNESFSHGYAKEKKSKISKSTFRGSLVGVVAIILFQINM